MSMGPVPGRPPSALDEEESAPMEDGEISEGESVRAPPEEVEEEEAPVQEEREPDPHRS